jgi:hypothetical protein
MATARGEAMATAQAFVFDSYGTLFDVHSVVNALRAVTPEAEAVSQQWRQKQLEYSWLRSLMGRYVDFWTVTDEALDSLSGAMVSTCSQTNMPRSSTPISACHPIQKFLPCSNSSRRDRVPSFPMARRLCSRPWSPRAA